VFDLRYHVVSLAAVFLALVLGIVIGAAIADPELADRAENQTLRAQVEDLRERLERERVRAERFRVAEAFVDSAYDALMEDRLAETRVLVVSVGAADDRADAVEAAIVDADGSVARTWALQLPSDAGAIARALAGRPALTRYADGDLAEVGRDFARELVAGGATPLLDALSSVLGRRVTGEFDRAVDATVVIRSAPPQRRELGDFVNGLYRGLDSAAPAVGAEFTSSRPSAVRVFARAGLATIDNVETEPGKVALAVLVAGGADGHYGVKETAENGVLPPIEPVVRPTE
jgi:copper transport outer membrane protein MctB